MADVTAAAGTNPINLASQGPRAVGHLPSDSLSRCLVSQFNQGRSAPEPAVV